MNKINEEIIAEKFLFMGVGIVNISEILNTIERAICSKRLEDDLEFFKKLADEHSDKNINSSSPWRIADSRILNRRNRKQSRR